MALVFSGKAVQRIAVNELPNAAQSFAAGLTNTDVILMQKTMRLERTEKRFKLLLNFVFSSSVCKNECSKFHIRNYFKFFCFNKLSFILYISVKIWSKL